MRIHRRGCSNGDTRRVGRVRVGLVRRDVAALGSLIGAGQAQLFARLARLARLMHGEVEVEVERERLLCHWHRVCLLLGSHAAVGSLGACKDKTPVGLS